MKKSILLNSSNHYKDSKRILWITLCQYVENLDINLNIKFKFKYLNSKFKLDIYLNLNLDKI